MEVIVRLMANEMHCHLQNFLLPSSLRSAMLAGATNDKLAVIKFAYNLALLQT